MAMLANGVHLRHWVSFPVVVAIPVVLPQVLAAFVLHLLFIVDYRLAATKHQHRA
jgi:hypothetical protein